MTTPEQQQNQDLIRPTSKTVHLQQGVRLGDNIIHDITVCKPNTGHFRGVSIRKLQDFYPEEMAVFLPKVTSPAIPAEAIMQMEFDEFLELAGAALSFIGEGKEPSPTESKK